MSITRQELSAHLQQLLEVARFKDYCPNGLQIEGREPIRRIMTAVTASQAVIDAAVAAQADALLVHHGFFWKSEAAPIVRGKKQRIAALLQHDINLFAYHLPLDAHPELGNNAQLGQLLGITPTGRFGDQDLGWLGEFQDPISWEALIERTGQRLQRAPLALGDPQRPIRRVAWCTGGAQGYFHQAAELDIDCFITGEASEFVTHLARESQIGFLAAGHHATERGGIQALGTYLAQHYQLEHLHHEIDNPV